MRKYLLLLPFVALGGIAHAQTPAVAVPLQPLNCDALSTGTLICVRDATPQSITKITCYGASGLVGSSSIDLNIPHGIIHSGESTIVDFKRDRCNEHIHVFLRDGHQLSFDGFDTKTNTILLVDES